MYNNSQDIGYLRKIEFLYFVKKKKMLKMKIESVLLFQNDE